MSVQPFNVLLIDDNEQIGALIGSVLREKDVAVETAGTGLEGLAKAAHGHFDLAVVDIGLPDISGLEVLRRFKSNKDLRHIPVIILTGEHGAEDKIQAFELGAVDYVTKPFSVPELRARILATLRQKEVQEKRATGAQPARSEADIRRISKAIDSASDAICILDETGKVVFLNNAFLAMFEVSAEKVAEIESIQPVFSDPDQWQTIWEFCHSHGAWKGEASLTSSQGGRLSTLCRADSIADGEGAFQGVVVIFTDISRRKRLEQDLVFLARFDSLTGIYTRRYFGELLSDLVQRAEGGKTSFLLYLDLDNFKVVNDSVGHEAGDRMLVEVAHTLAQSIRDRDLLGRFGGDEFVIACRDVEETEAIRIARRLLGVFEDFRFSFGERTFATSVSIGLAQIDRKRTVEDFLARADSACNHAKARGRNCWALFREDNQEMQRLSTEANWALQLRDALRDDRLELWLQPIVPFDPSLEHFHEVLLRMRDPDGNLVLPGAFLPAAERFGNMLRLDRVIISKAVHFLKERPEIKLTINLSAQTLIDPELAEWLIDLFQRQQVAPRRVAFEITETVVIHNLAEARRLMAPLRQAGFRFALDDFGAGASSMMYLRDLPVDLLKIDGTFIENIDEDLVNRSLVKSMIEVAHVLGKLVVAEYVVSPAVREVVRQLGADYIQGWSVSEPYPAEDESPVIIPARKHA